MPGILEFLQSNPELAFQLLQVGGNSLAQAGGQFDAARGYNSQAKANRQNSLIGALSMGQVPGTSVGRVPGPGFMSSLGMGLGTIGEMGSTAFDLKRQKAEEEFRKKQQKLEERRQELLIKKTEQEISANDYSIEDAEVIKQNKEGANLYRASLAAAVNAHISSDQFKGKKKEEIPLFDPSHLVMPDQVVKAHPNIQAGWQAAAEASRDKYTDNLVQIENANTRKYEAEQRAIDSKERLAARQAQLNAMGMEKEAKDLESNQRVRNDASREAERLSERYKLHEIEDGFSNITTGYKTKKYGFMMIGIERLINTGTVFPGELERDIQMVMAPSAQVMKSIKNALTAPDDQPIQLSDEAAKVMHDYATRLVHARVTTYNQHLDKIKQKYVGYKSRGGTSIDPMDIEAAVITYTPMIEFEADPADQGQQKLHELREFSKQQSLLPNDPEPPKTDRMDSSRKSIFDSIPAEEDSTIHQGGFGGIFGGDSQLPSWLMAGAGLYGGKKILDKWGSSIFPPGSAAAANNSPGVDMPTSSVPTGTVDRNYQPNGYDPNSVQGTYDPNPRPATQSNYDPNARQFNFDPNAGRTQTNYSPNAVQSNYDPMAQGIYDPGKNIQNSYDPTVSKTPGTSQMNYNENFAWPSNTQEMAAADQALETMNPKTASPSTLKRLIQKNPALAKAMGFLDAADRYMGGFAGGLVNTNLLQQHVNRALYGPRGYD